MDLYLKLVIGCLIFLLIIGFARILSGKKGTWTRAAPPTFEPLILREGADNDSSGEQRVRAYLERYFGQKFYKVRPFFLENEVTGQTLELDCYNEDLKLAVEYNGRQHYQYTPYFHANYEAFRNQQYRDQLKKIYCREHGIDLITVPYTVRDIERYLAQILQEKKLAPPE
jgi:hypothetical protein